MTTPTGPQPLTPTEFAEFIDRLMDEVQAMPPGMSLTIARVEGQLTVTINYPNSDR